MLTNHHPQPRNPTILADSISNADFDIAPELSSSAASVAPSSSDPHASVAGDGDQVQTPITPGNLSAFPDLDGAHLKVSLEKQHQKQRQLEEEQYQQYQQLLLQQRQEQQLHEIQQLQEQQQQLEQQQPLEQQQQQQLEQQQLEHLALLDFQQQQQQQLDYLEPPASPLIEMEQSRLGERDRLICPEVQAFLSAMEPDHQSFWLSQRRDRLRFSADDRHHFIVQQALALHPLLLIEDVGEFCMHQQGMIFEDLRAEGAPICSTAWFNWRLDKDIWDRFVGSVTGEPSMWADDAPPIERPPYLAGYKLTVFPPAPPSVPSPAVTDAVLYAAPQGYLLDGSASPGLDAQPRYAGPGLGIHDPFPSDPIMTPPTSPTSLVRPRAHSGSGSGSSNMARKPSRPQTTTSATRSHRPSFAAERALSAAGSDGELGTPHGLAHMEDAKGMPGMFKAVNYQPVYWG